MASEMGFSHNPAIRRGRRGSPPRTSLNRITPFGGRQTGLSVGLRRHSIPDMLAISLEKSDSRSGSRLVVLAVGGAFASGLFWTFAHLAIPESLALSLGLLKARATGAAFTVGSLLGWFVARAPLSSADVGWRKSHNKEAVLEPLLAPFLQRLTPTQVERARRAPDTFVHRVFLPLVASENSVAHLRARFFVAFTIQRFARLARIILGLGVSTAILLGSSGTVLSTQLWHWTAVALGCGVLNEVFLRMAVARMIQISAEEVQWIHDQRRQDLEASLTAYVGPLAHVAASGASSGMPSGSQQNLIELATAGEVEYRVSLAILSAARRIVFRFPTSLPEKWEYHLIPAILFALHRGVSIDFVLRGDSQSKKRNAYKLLERLGCRVTYCPDSDDATSELSCVLVDPGQRSAATVLLTADGSPVRGLAAHGPHLRNLVAHLTTDSIRGEQRDAPGLSKLRLVPTAVVRSRLKRVPWYRSDDCKIDVLDVELERTRPMSAIVRETGLLQVPYFAKLFDDAGLGLFAPASINVGDDLHSLILPPVLESDSRGFFRVHEGHSRVYECWQRAQKGGSKTIKAVVVEGCQPPPRMRNPLEWNQVVVRTDLVKDTSNDHSHGIESWTRAKIDSRGQKILELDFLTTSELSV